MRLKVARLLTIN